MHEDYLELTRVNTVDDDLSSFERLTIVNLKVLNLSHRVMVTDNVRLLDLHRDSEVITSVVLDVSSLDRILLSLSKVEPF